MPLGPRRVIGPAFTTRQILASVAAYPMRPSGTARWSGRFPLVRDGFYRVHLENELGATNQTMKEGKLTAIVDLPPQVTLERPSGDLSLSTPQKVPVVVSVYDDFALDELSLAVQPGEESRDSSRPEHFELAPVKKFGSLVRNEMVVCLLDLTAYKLRPGQQVRDRLEVRDRKGQTRADAGADDPHRGRRQRRRQAVGPLRRLAGRIPGETVEALEPAK